MTEAEALDLERYWGAPGPPPNPKPGEAPWRCCMRCGEYWSPDGRQWCDPQKRLCRACKNDEKRGIYPRSRQWHRKNRWTADGRIVRRCNICTCWKPLAQFYLVERRDAKQRTRWWYPWAMCIPCGIARKGYRSAAEMRRELREQRRAEA